METLTEAVDRLRAAGYTADFSAVDDGLLECGACGRRHDPATADVHDTVRFEGQSDPGDMAILLAIQCANGDRGLYSAAFGPDTPPEDSAVLLRFAHR